jgi:high-affinity Fe2+/Pb2+ permease
MEMPRKPEHSSRDTMLGFILVIVLGGAFLFFLNLVSLGIFFYVIAAVVGMAAVGFLHYVVWGYDLSEEVAEERQREWLKEQQEMDERGF